MRTVHGDDASATVACPRTGREHSAMRTRTARGPGHDCGLCADAESLRTRRVCGRGEFADTVSLRTRRVCGRGEFADADSAWPRQLGWSLRGHRAPFLRLVRGRQNLPAGRGNACLLLNTMSDTVPPLLLQFVPPPFQLGDHGGNAAGLLHRLRLNPGGVLIAVTRFRQTHDTFCGVVFDTAREPVEHGDGCAELVMCGSVHGHTRMQRDDFRTSSCR